jgi:hypothetical protein
MWLDPRGTGGASSGKGVTVTPKDSFVFPITAFVFGIFVRLHREKAVLFGGTIDGVSVILSIRWSGAGCPMIGTGIDIGLYPPCPP